MSDARDPARAGHRTVLVAGGTGALGGAVLRALLDADYPVVASWLLETERDRVYDEFPTADQLTLVHADLTDASSVGSAVADVRDLGAVVNLVGGYVDGTKVHETDPEAFDAMLRINLRPGFLLARAAMPQLIAAGGGAFVGVSARAALAPFPGAAGYITAKAAVLAFIQALDTEYRDAGIRCNAVLPALSTPPRTGALNPTPTSPGGSPLSESPRSSASSSRRTPPRSAVRPSPSTAEPDHPLSPAPPSA